MSAFAGILAGYKLKVIEFFLECGWEHSQLKATGDMTIAPSEAGGLSETIHPSLTLKGRNMFRAALNIAFPIGWMPVVGGNAGAELGNTVNILSYKYVAKAKEKKAPAAAEPKAAAPQPETKAAEPAAAPAAVEQAAPAPVQDAVKQEDAKPLAPEATPAPAGTAAPKGGSATETPNEPIGQ